MQEIIELLKEKGFVDGVQRALDVTTAILGDRDDDSPMNAAKYCLFEFLKKHDDVEDKFVEFASDYAAEAIVKALDLKPNKDYKPDALEKIVALLAGVEVLKKNKEDK